MKKTTRLSLLTSIVASTCLFTPSLAHAADCNFVSVVGVLFGAYDIFSLTPLDSTGNVTFNCTSVGDFDVITIDLSTGSAADYAPRKMSHGAFKLSYNVFLNAARTTVWGDQSGATSNYGPMTPPEGTDVDIPTYGRIPAQQDAYAAAFADTVIVTINY